MSHPLEYFQNIFIINLPERKDRRREMEAELREIGYSPEKVTWFAAIRPSEAGDFESIGARGCFMSHLSVLKTGMSSGFERMLILEDDCAFESDFVSRLSAIVDALSGREWDVFYAGGAPVEPLAPSDGLNVVPPENAVRLAHCIGFNGPAIWRACNYIELQLSRPYGHANGGPMHVDGSYSWARKELQLITLIADPIICRQRSSRSDIAELPLWDRVPVVRDAVQFLRTVKRRWS